MLITEYMASLNVTVRKRSLITAPGAGGGGGGGTSTYHAYGKDPVQVHDGMLIIHHLVDGKQCTSAFATHAIDGYEVSQRDEADKS